MWSQNANDRNVSVSTAQLVRYMKYIHQALFNIFRKISDFETLSLIITNYQTNATQKDPRIHLKKKKFSKTTWTPPIIHANLSIFIRTEAWNEIYITSFIWQYGLFMSMAGTHQWALHRGWWTVRHCSKQTSVFNPQWVCLYYQHHNT
jgi:hypothetical protein